MTQCIVWEMFKIGFIDIVVHIAFSARFTSYLSVEYVNRIIRLLSYPVPPD